MTDVTKARILSSAPMIEPWGFPALKKTHFVPLSAIPFEKALKSKNYNQWVHFYTADRNFHRFWNNPYRYLEILRKFSGVITPDFSVYRDYPWHDQLYNASKNRTLAYMLQSEGVNTIFNVRWGDESTYCFAFNGLEKGGTYAISTHGVVRKAVEREYFQKGLTEMVKYLEPETLVCHGSTPYSIFIPYIEQGISVIRIPSYIEMIHAKRSE